MLFHVELEPSPYKQGNAAHFINVERRLKLQVPFLRKLKDEGIIVDGPWAILNCAMPRVAYVAECESWEHLSRVLHDDPMMIYQAPRISYLSDWEEGMAKHADTIGSEGGRTDLEQDVLIDQGEGFGVTE